MAHPLDNPIWHALRTGNQALALGDLARVLPREVGAFVGLAEFSPRAFARLRELVPASAPVVLFTAEALSVPNDWKQLFHKELLQLVYPLAEAPMLAGPDLVPLGEPDIPAMLALTALTNPGPFLARTIDFGGYHGIFQDDQLVAMAGQRLQPIPYTEISAVCTHPAHLGHGYARQLVQQQLNLLAAGRMPFLHVYEDNTPAYPLYLKLGFQLRRRLHVFVLEKPAS
jgi:predicted GNAT family acetyltransferase